MLNVAPLTSIVPVMGTIRARNFYEQELGLKAEGRRNQGRLHHCALRGR